MTERNLPVRGDRPGWTGLIETLEKRIENAESRRTGRPRVTASAVVDGVLTVEIREPAPFDLGAAAVAGKLSGEICDQCGRKGDPVGPARTPASANPARTGCRCGRCRTPDTVPVPRDWPAPADREPDAAVSPGQWTQDLRGGTTGADWDARDWRNYGRIEDEYRKQMELLMSATDDEEAMRLWAGGPGWAGLIRALFLTLRSEQDDRPDDPNHVPWRLRWMKEKWGYLDVRTTATTPYQDGAVFMIGALSTRTCIHCGSPAEIRHGRWVRPECDDCWARASPEDKAADAENRPSGP